MRSALLQAGITTFGILTFGENVRMVKMDRQEWDAQTILGFLLSLNFDVCLGTADADAIDVALALISQSSIHGEKKIFVFTDGYSTHGLRLTESLFRADQNSVDVIGVSVGMEKTFVSSCYENWINAALPSAFPSALRALYSQDAVDIDANAAPAPVTALRLKLRSKSEASVQEILEAATTVFPTMRDGMRKERELKLSSGSGAGGAMTLDVCFVIDITGSMGPYLAAVKAQVRAVQTGIVNKLKEEKNQAFAHLDIKLRFGFLGYRDVGEQSVECRFDEKTFTTKVRASLF
jgi:hypothetical protein